MQRPHAGPAAAAIGVGVPQQRRGRPSSGANLVPDGARKSRHFRRPGTSTTRSIRRYASPSSPTPRCCGRRPNSAMRSTRRGAPDPAQHDQINFYGTCSFDVETELRREGHRPLTHQPPHLLAAGRRDQIRSAAKAIPDWQQQHRRRARQPKVKRTEADPITPCPPRTALPCCRQRDRGRLARRCELPALVAPGEEPCHTTG